MEVMLHYVDAKKGIVERSKEIIVEPDADMQELVRFVRFTIPKVLGNPS